MTPELVGEPVDGVVSVVDPQSIDVIDSCDRSVPFWIRPTLIDLDGEEAIESGSRIVMGAWLCYYSMDVRDEVGDVEPS